MTTGNSQATGGGMVGGITSSDRDFIERKFRDGCCSADLDNQSGVVLVCPYEDSSLAAHWWRRGYAYEARNLRAISVEASLTALTAALEGLEQEMTARVKSMWKGFWVGHEKASPITSQEVTKWADRLEALRTP